jgi:fucose 4-O-acetylase-like acetyltransferase
MPLFFFISGLVTKDSIGKKPFLKYLKDRAFRLLIPYMNFSIISYLAWLFLLQNFKKQQFHPLKSLIAILYSSGSDYWLSFNIAIWFLTCLFVTQIIFFFLSRIDSKKIFVTALFLFSIIGYMVTFINSPDNRLPWSIQVAPTATVFYGIGYLSKPYFLTDAFTKWHRWSIMLASLSCYLLFTTINIKVDFYVGVYGNYAYFYLAALSGILFWAHVAQLVKPNRLFTAIGQNTLVIFSLHLLVIPLLTGFLTYALKIPESYLEKGIVPAFGYMILSILLLLPVSELMNKYTPMLVGRNSSNRIG